MSEAPLNEWMDAKEAADRLQVSERQINRRGNEGSIQTKRIGRRVLYLRTDVDRLREELGVTHRPRARIVPKREMVPIGETVAYIAKVNSELAQAREEVGYLRGQLDAQQRMIADTEQLRATLSKAEQRIAELEREREQHTPRSWWKRLIRRS